MKKKMILFDLDGTLLPMDQDEFIGAYFKALLKKLIFLGLPGSSAEEQQALGKTVWACTHAMMSNDGTCTNEERFFSTFSTLTGIDIAPLKEEFDRFYINEFEAVSAVCGRNPLVRETIDRLKAEGYRVAVATNPLFPLKANERRLAWAGLSLSDFEYCTCYENLSVCKPKLEYYRAILEHLGVSAEECVMVGNDVREDMVARKLGMDVFLITDYLLNKDGENIENYPHGSWKDFQSYIFD